MLPGIPTSSMRWGAATSSASGTSLALPYPTNNKCDEVLVCFAGANASTLITSLGGSWVDDVRHSGTADTAIPSIYLAHRISSAALSGNLTVTVPNVATRGVVVAVREVDLQNIIDFTASTAFKDQTTAQSTNVIPAGTCTRPQTVGLSMFCGNGSAHTWTPPTNWTEQLDGDGSCPLEVNFFSQTANGTTGTLTGTDSGSVKSLGQAIFLRPRPVNPQLLAA